MSTIDFVSVSWIAAQVDVLSKSCYTLIVATPIVIGCMSWLRKGTNGRLPRSVKTVMRQARDSIRTHGGTARSASFNVHVTRCAMPLEYRGWPTARFKARYEECSGIWHVVVRSGVADGWVWRPLKGHWELPPGAPPGSFLDPTIRSMRIEYVRLVVWVALLASLASVGLVLASFASGR